MTVLLYLLIFQAVLGGFDVLWNHEYKEKLPQQCYAALEQKIHGVRELLYAFIFFAIACFQWHGYWAYLLALLLVIEIMLTAWDFIIEDQTRKLSAVERTTHLILSINAGAYIALLIPILRDWTSKPNQLLTINYGSISYLLVFFGFAVLLWGYRDLFAGIYLSRSHSQPPLLSKD